MIKTPLIVIGNTVRQAELWAKQNILGSSKKPIALCPETLDALRGVRGLTILIIEPQLYNHPDLAVLVGKNQLVRV